MTLPDIQKEGVYMPGSIYNYVIDKQNDKFRIPKHEELIGLLNMSLYYEQRDLAKNTLFHHETILKDTEINHLKVPI